MLRYLRAIIFVFILIGGVETSIAFNVGGPSYINRKVHLELGLNFGLAYRMIKENKDMFSFRIFPKTTVHIGSFGINIMAGAGDYHKDGKDYPLGFAGGGGFSWSLLPESSFANLTLFADGFYWRPSSIDLLEITAGGMLVFKGPHTNIYAGAKYSDVIENFDRFISKIPFGVVIGIDYYVNPNLFLNAEMHNFDQDAIYLGAGYSF